MINWGIAASPFNWLTVVLVTAFALLFLHILSPQDQSSPETSTT